MKRSNARVNFAGVLVWFCIMAFLGHVPARAETSAEVANVTARQRYPWNGLVDITCTVTGITGNPAGLKFTVAAVDGESGTVQDVSHVRLLKEGTESDDLTVAANGDYKLVWDAQADLGEGQWSNMVVRVTVAGDDPTPREGQLWAGGPVWADRNIGAENPWNYGLYFWVGDTTGHRPSGTTFSFDFDSDNSAISTYGKDIATLQSEGWVVSKDGSYVLAPEHDAAHVHWGGEWRLPTYQELYDLCRNKCDWTWTATNGVNGYVVRGRGVYAVNSIFLPAAGIGFGTSLIFDGIYGGVRLSDPGSGAYIAEYLYFTSSGYYGMASNDRFHGFSVRPVRGGAE